ncbi:MAG: cob(I)yrinic acid a,c-diamide adenosyltransferase [Patescibacteria group bacterium]|nr:cob(I)yrinic acid a,c-diamide adenosyltransferase [Patescibacteria group bacterium]
MALYTGRGDDGTTKVFDSKERVLKSSELPECLGTLDELNSFIGLCKARARAEGGPSVTLGRTRYDCARILHGVQETLFIIQAEVAGAQKKVGKARLTEAERLIHAIEGVIPPIVSFSIAGGTELSALLDVARTLARRAERRLSSVEGAGLRKLSLHTRAYANRLSSLLFALARLANHESGLAEESPRYR